MQKSLLTMLFPVRKRNDPYAVRYATFTNRMLASTIDIGILFILVTPLVDYMVAQVFDPIDSSKVMAVLSSDTLRGDPDRFLSLLWQMTKEQHLLGRIVLENMLQIAIIAAYMLPFWFRYSTSPGMFIFRLEIQDEATGAHMTRRQAVIRFLGFFVSALPLSLGFVWIIFNKKRQGFHDMIAKTVVIIKPKRRREDGTPPSETPPP